MAEEDVLQGTTLVLKPTRIEAKSVKWDKEVQDNWKEDPVEEEPDQEVSQGENDEAEVREEGKTRYRHTVKIAVLYGFDYRLTMRLTPVEKRFYHKMIELQELSLFTTSRYNLESDEIADEVKEELHIED